MDRFQDYMNSTGTYGLTSSHLPFNAPPCVQVEFCKSQSRNGGLVLETASCESTVLTLQQEFADNAALFNLIKTCGKQKDLHRGSSIHASLLRRGFLAKDVTVNNALLSMYAKCGVLARARDMFDDLPARTVVSWNALIGAYVLHGFNREALTCFECMQDEGLSPNAVTFRSILKACGSLGAAKEGENMHAKISEQGLLQNDVILGTALVDMYVKCGVLSKAQAVLDKLPGRNVATWTALIMGYVQQGLNSEALGCFKHMKDEGLSPDAIAFICILKACGSLGAIEMGRDIHREIDRQGLFPGESTTLGNSLVDMYVKCGAFAEAQEVFNMLPTRDTTTWTTLIAGFADHKLGERALKCFEQMQNEGHAANEVTFICILKACAIVGAIDLGEKVHEAVEKQGLLYKYIMLGTALVDMYFKCGLLAKAQQVFDKLPDRNIVTWNVLIAGYVLHDLGDEALSYYTQMLDEGFVPDAITKISILKACSSIGAVEQGVEIHKKMCKVEVEGDAALGTALVDMYAKCGAPERAQKVFDEVPERGVAIWNALITGYAQVGKVKTFFKKFSSMVRDGVQPSVVTFVVLFTMCSHEGLVEEGLTYFDDMISSYNVIPTSEHRTCVVDALSRAGQFDKAVSFIEKAPQSDGLLLWLALMSACMKYLSLKLGRWAFENALQLDEKFPAAYVVMGNLYVASDMQEE